MLYQKKHEAKADTFDSSCGSVIFLGLLGFVMLSSANAVIGLAIWSLYSQEWRTITVDFWISLGLLLVGTIGALLIDAQALLEMFGKPSRLSDKGDDSSNPIVSLYGLKGHERAVNLCTTTVNWLTAHGLICASLKLGMTNPLGPNAIKMNVETLHDLVSGDVLLNPLIRAWNWEAVYGMCCALHLGVYFSVSVAHRANWNLKRLAPKAICYFTGSIMLMALAGFFRVRQYSPGWIGPSDGFWLVFCHVIGLYMAYDQYCKTRKPAVAEEEPEFQEGLLAFADQWRGWKPVTVFVTTSFISVVFAYASPIYPIVLFLTYCYYWKTHRMDRGWNKVLFFLTIVHQVLHYFVHSYRTIEDQPLLWIDKFVHFLYAVVAAQQFHDNKEMLSKDPLVRGFNYINIFIWIPGDIIAMYITAFHGPDDVYLKHLIAWGGYCLSTGTAMAYVNNDVEEDNAPDSSRRFIANREGVTGHGIQIFQALLFAVVYIVSTGGSAEYGYKIECLYEYAAHLYTGYGSM